MKVNFSCILLRFLLDLYIYILNKRLNRDFTMGHAIWCWNSARNSWLTMATKEFNAVWKTYSDIQCNIIKEAFYTGQDQVTVDDYIIDLRQFLQINIDDESKQ
ncbi:unnamed protein product [Adineta ricciae]|uniref:Uncharacterized protein n=1 Tax=Adineta ricciae TaxID=249248 RepID=A0A815TAF5_ADIRI|nr:unnamed protein product [Adineta ricciae]